MSADITHESLVTSLLGALESGHVVITTEGSLLFDDASGRAIEAVVDDTTHQTADVTLWADDENGDALQLTTLRVTVDVVA
jgi:hypothetical protein